MIGTMLVLFGLRLGPLYDAIAQVESDRGATSANVYQIRAICVADVNRVWPRCHYTMTDVLEQDKAEMIMYRYWWHWGERYERVTGKRVTYEVLARIHNGGPNGWRKTSTERYWEKVKKVLGEGLTSHQEF